MPKIRNINLFYEGEKSTRHEIHYSHKSMFYIKGLSDEFLGITGIRSYGYETEHMLVNTVQDACRKYRKLKTTAKWVILYSCCASPELRMNKISEGSYQGLLSGVSPKIIDTGFGGDLACFSIDYDVAQVVDDGVKKKFYKVDVKTKEVNKWEMQNIIHHQMMDYTEERLQFFESIVESMKKMVVAASKFFGAEPEQAALFIEQKQKLLGD